LALMARGTLSSKGFKRRSDTQLWPIMDSQAVYATSAANLSEEHLGGFFVGWPNPPSPTNHLRLLRGSQYVVIASEPTTGKVVGFITAISDEVLCAYVPLLEVLPKYQGRGIGGELVERMLAELAHLYMVDLLCDPSVQPFYERFKMRKATGMMIRNYDRQDGSAV